MSRTVTYSPAYTLVPTYECFNRCTYCNFRAQPLQSPWLTLPEAETQLELLLPQGVIEILILSGEVHPESQRRKAWFQRIYDLCELALALGFLPHTNVGPLSFEEMAQLKQVNVSMGLMLEQLSPDLLQTVHRHAPSKVPTLRLEQLEFAGQLQIPFTTGLLLGIGETEADWIETLEAIARSILPSEISLQIPPNLVARPEILLACLEAGATDLGGIGPLDEVNPDYPHLQHQTLTEILAAAGWQLMQRLPVYPQYDNWLPQTLQTAIKKWRVGGNIYQI